MTDAWFTTTNPARVMLLSERWLSFDVDRLCSWAPIDPRRYRPAPPAMLAWLDELARAPEIRAARFPLDVLVDWAWSSSWRFQRVLGEPFDRRRFRQAINPAVNNPRAETLRLSLVGPLQVGNERRSHVLLVEGHDWRAHLMGVLASDDEIGHDPLGEGA